MAVKKEFYKTRADGVQLVRTYSTDGLPLKKKGTSEVYEEAIDISTSKFEYEEVVDVKEGDHNG